MQTGETTLLKTVFCTTAMIISISACTRWLVPWGLTVVPPVLGEQQILASLPTSTRLGMELPEELRGISLPVTIVAHVDCLGCTTKTPPKIEEAFNLSGVEHVVFAADPEPYDWMAEKLGTSKPRKGSLSAAEALGAGFGPRVYRFNKDGRLVYAQMDQGQPLREAVHEAEHH